MEDVGRKNHRMTAQETEVFLVQLSRENEGGSLNGFEDEERD